MRDEIWDILKERSKTKFDEDRARFLTEASRADDGNWTKHSEYHWFRLLNGQRLDYWPSRRKYQYLGKIARGNIYKFIERTLNEQPK
jgi:hypothetical protein